MSRTLILSDFKALNRRELNGMVKILFKNKEDAQALYDKLILILNSGEMKELDKAEEISDDSDYMSDYGY